MLPMVRLRRKLVGEAPLLVEPPILGEAATEEDPPIVGERWTVAEELLGVKVDVGEARLALEGDEISGLLLLSTPSSLLVETVSPLLLTPSEGPEP